MKDSLTSNNYQDFRQRYEGTFGFLIKPNDHKKLLVQLVSVNSEQVDFLDKNGHYYNVVCDSGVPFEFIPVDRRVVNLQRGRTVFACRKPARQWKRGVCADNTVFVNIETGKTLSVGFDLIESVYSQDETSYVDYYQQYKSGKRFSVALSDKFCVFDGNLFLYNTKVGSLKDDVAKVSTLFRQELSDVCKRNNLPITVEVL